VVASTWLLGACQAGSVGNGSLPGDAGADAAPAIDGWNPWNTGSDAGDGGTGDGGGTGDAGACASELGANPTMLLADPANCGACGHDCLGGSCTSGLCQPSALGDTGGANWHVWNKGLYWAGGLSAQQASVLRFDTVSGNTSVAGTVKVPYLEEDENYAPSAYLYVAAVDDAGVYVSGWAATSPNVQRWNLQLLPHTGGAPTVLADGYVPELTVDASTVYFRRFAAPSGGSRAEALYSMPRAGGASKLVASLGSALLGTGGLIPFDSRRWLSVHDGFVYAVTSSNSGSYTRDEISRVPAGGGAFSKLVQGTEIHTIVGFGGDEMFYIQGPSTAWQVMRRNVKTGQTATVLDQTDRVDMRSFAVDATSVYFIDKDKGVRRLVTSTGKVSSLAEYPTLTVRDLVQDEQALYWAVDNGNGGHQLMKLAK
jgi:hypothetical protein